MIKEFDDLMKEVFTKEQREEVRQEAERILRKIRKEKGDPPDGRSPFILATYVFTSIKTGGKYDDEKIDFT